MVAGSTATGLEARALVKVFGRTVALRDVSFAAPPGAITVVEGQNGSGKSTLLALLAGLMRPTRGEVRFGGAAVGPGSLALRRALGLVSHAPLLYPDLTGRENLALFAALHDVSRAPAAIETAAARFALDGFWDRPARTYSRGQAQRVSLARALLGAPALLLLDEPTTGLDAPSREALENTLREERGRGATVVLVTHDAAWSAPLADQRVVLDAGGVREGAP